MGMYKFECPHCGSHSLRVEYLPQPLTCPKCKKDFTSEGELVDELAVALSGGGHRASLFGLGVLLALVDLGLNQRVIYISSVSGGSITNAFVGLHCKFEEQTPETFERIATKLIGTIVSLGVLTRGQITLVFGVLIVPPIVMHATYWFCNPGPTGLSVSIVWVIFLTLALLRGLVVERLLSRRFFRGPRRAARFKDMAAKAVEHVLCCTEVATGRPFYFNSWNSGRMYFRREESAFKDMFEKQHLIRSCPDLKISTAVRASAAFPGIPPRRLSMGRFPMPAPQSDGTRQHDEGHLKASDDPTVFLSDGGIWNNFGTQSLLEDKIYEGSANAHAKPKIILVANASANFAATRSWQFHVPVWAEFKALLRAVGILSVNTVEPRRVSFREMLMRRISHDTGDDSREPLGVLIDIDKTVGGTASDFRQAFVGRDVFRMRSQEYRDWIEILATKLEEWKNVNKGKENPDLQGLFQLVETEFLFKPKFQVDPSERVGTLIDEYSSLEASIIQYDLGSLPTTLGKIPSKDAKRLLARGYANTHIVAYCLGLTDSVDVKMTENRLGELTQVRGD
jgi:predicted acylesterase/phospholipase RssA